jgi:hypothetical protein
MLATCFCPSFLKPHKDVTGFHKNASFHTNAGVMATPYKNIAVHLTIIIKKKPPRRELWWP